MFFGIPTMGFITIKKKNTIWEKMDLGTFFPCTVSKQIQAIWVDFWWQNNVGKYTPVENQRLELYKNRPFTQRKSIFQVVPQVRSDQNHDFLLYIGVIVPIYTLYQVYNKNISIIGDPYQPTSKMEW